jgi:flagellar protein FliO/FliZ
MVLVLAVVVAGIYGVFFLLRKTGKPKEKQSGSIRILGSTTLGSSRYLHIVAVGRQVFLVGTGEGGVSLLSEITDHETIDSLMLEASNKPTGSGAPEKRNFASIMIGLLNRESRKKAGTDGSGPGIPMDRTLDFMKNQRERLKKY